MSGPTLTHPVLACAEAIEVALKDVGDVDPIFMSTADKRVALRRLGAVSDRVEELRLRLLAASDDVAEADGARDPAAWVAHHTRRDPGRCRRDLRLARSLASGRETVARATREGEVDLAQAETICRALDDLPEGLDRDVVSDAECRLVEQAREFAPHQLRLLGRRILDVVAPEIGEQHEAEALRREERHAVRTTFLLTHRNGDGTTDLTARLADTVADRLLTYLHAFTSPRRPTTDEGGQPSSRGTGHRRPHAQRLGQAFGTFLETTDPAGLPLHGGAATTVVVTVDLGALRADLGVALVGDQPVSAAHARRLACTARIVPAVLGGESQILDLGRSRRLFSPAQRTAMAVRDRTCRAEGCDIPAAWCEAHHSGTPWAQGGLTDLGDGRLLCAHHHHRAHDPDYDTSTHADGDVRFHRRH